MTDLVNNAQEEAIRVGVGDIFATTMSPQHDGKWIEVLIEELETDLRLKEGSAAEVARCSLAGQSLRCRGGAAQKVLSERIFQFETGEPLEDPRDIRVYHGLIATLVWME